MHRVYQRVINTQHKRARHGAYTPQSRMRCSAHPKCTPCFANSFSLPKARPEFILSPAMLASRPSISFSTFSLQFLIDSISIRSISLPDRSGSRLSLSLSLSLSLFI